MDEIKKATSEEISKLIDKSVSAVLEQKMQNIVELYTKRLQNFLLNFMQGGANLYKKEFGIKVKVNYDLEVEPPFVRLNVVAQIPPDEIQRIRKTLYKKYMENNNVYTMRIDAIYRLITTELQALHEGGEEVAENVLSDLYSGTGESEAEDRGD